MQLTPPSYQNSPCRAKAKATPLSRAFNTILAKGQAIRARLFRHGDTQTDLSKTTAVRARLAFSLMVEERRERGRGSARFYTTSVVAVFTCRFPVFSSPIPTTVPSSSDHSVVQLPDCPTVHTPYPIIRPRTDLGSPHDLEKPGGRLYIGISGFATGGLFVQRTRKTSIARNGFFDSIHNHGAVSDEERLLGP